MTTVFILNIFVFLNVGCDGGDVPIPDTVSFKENLSEYEIYDGNMKIDRVSASDTHNSTLM